MNNKKIILLLSLLVIFGVLFNTQLPTVKAMMTTEEITALIQKLQQQIADLQKQLTQTQSAVPQWCHDFNVSLKVGMTGAEIEALHTVLTKEGFNVSGEEKNEMSFDESTASAVTGFQMKYRDEILSPLGLKYGTGFVGRATKTKLNQLYGCFATAQPTPPPVQPTPVCIQVITPAQNPLNNDCKNFSTPCDVPSSWKKVSSCPVSIIPIPTPTTPTITTSTIPTTTCNSLACSTGYTASSTGEKYSNGCPVQKCVQSTSQPVVGTGTHKFEVLDASKCPGCPVSTTCTPCPDKSTYTIYNAKVIVYDEKGSPISPISTKDTRSGMAVFENLPYGNYIVTIGATGYETSKLTFTVGTNYVDTSTVMLKKLYLTVVSPNGGEKWQKGSSQTIKWNSSSIANVYIQLRKNSQPYSGSEGAISNTIPNTGSFQWTIPPSLPDGDDYTIVVLDPSTAISDVSDSTFSIVTSIDTTSEKTCAELQLSQKYYFDACSDNGYNNVCLNKFSAVYQGCTKDTWNDCTQSNANAAQNILCPVASVSHNITVLSPNGGEAWEMGKNYTIKWSAAGYSSSAVMRIILTDERTDSTKSFSESPLFNVYNTGSSNWTIPLSYQAHANYKIKITTPDEISDKSDSSFSIVSSTVSPSVNVMVPKGGEQYKIGDDIVISWQNPGIATGADLRQTVQLIKADANKTVVRDLGYTTGVGNPGEMKNIKWTVNADAGNYYIKVSNTTPAEHANLSGYSNMFTIISSATGLTDIENQLANIVTAASRLMEEIKNWLER